MKLILLAFAVAFSFTSIGHAANCSKIAKKCSNVGKAAVISQAMKLNCQVVEESFRVASAEFGPSTRQDLIWYEADAGCKVGGARVVTAVVQYTNWGDCLQY